MKREGRQHGVVRTSAILPLPAPSSQRRYVKTVDSASVAGLFTKVSRKPTNHSKFTGKCGTPRCNGCHIHPACKSKDKTKGTMKLRSIGSDPAGLVKCPAGTSATGALAYYLASDGSNFDDADEYEGAIYNDYDYREDDTNCDVEFGIGLASIVTEERIEVEDDDDDHLSYCDVGLCWIEGDTDDGWYLVGDFQ